MNNLLSNAKAIFGDKAKFIWDPAAVQTIPLSIGPKTSDRRVRDQDSVTLMNALTYTYNDPNAINIYFAGWIQHPSDNPFEETLAWTMDPGHVGQGFFTFDRPFILFNDGDWNTGVHLPAETEKLYLEHEMGHYLIRDGEVNGAYCQQTERLLYDDQEHFIAWPSQVDTDPEKKAYELLMKAGRYRPLFPRLDPLSRENAYHRFYDYRWQQP